jgi:hypothetical protein
MLNREISNSDDIIDSRDVIERIETLHSDAEGIWRDTFPTVELALDAELPEGFDPAAWLDSWDAEEYRALVKLAEAGEGAADWEYGATLIRDSYFETYAEQLAEDIGAVAHGQGWPLNHIDWEAAADALKIDYSEIDFDGVAYWARD